MISHKGYIGAFRYEPELDALYGSVVNASGVITFQGDSVDAVKAQFVRSVDEYLLACGQHGIEPAKPFSGRFNIRPGPELHGKLAAAAEACGTSMNEWIVRTLERAVQEADELVEVG
jgi:predicted HicB family RNase H-like nuclease